MSKFNTTAQRTMPRSARGGSPLKTRSATPDARTHEGGLAFSFEYQSELFMTLTGSFITEKGFYESGDQRVQRVRLLIKEIVANDPSEGREASGRWFAGFTKWLRTEAFIRTGAVVLAAEAVHARLAVGATGYNRDIVAGALARADEPGELLGYWLSRWGRPVPIAVKRGLADAVVGLYSEGSTLRYDTATHAIRFGDVLEFAQPRTNARTSAGVLNHELYRHLIDRRHAYNDNAIPEGLTMLRARAELEALPVSERRAVLSDPARLRAAGMSWEALSGWLQGPMDREAWEAIIPMTGYMALLRNLRNFDEAGVSDAVAAKVAAKLADPEQVSKSRQLPFRFQSAYTEVGHDRWRVALGAALELSTQNIPDALGGRTLVLVDTSGSMMQTVSERSKVSFHAIASLFGVALAYKFGIANVDLFGFADFAYPHVLKKGASVLPQVEAFVRTNGKAGYGTQIELSIKQAYKGHDRVVLFSDMQTFGSRYAGQASRLVPSTVPFFAFNLAGNSTTVIDSGPNRFQLGGLGDRTFSWMVQTEKGLDQGWPWMSEE